MKRCLKVLSVILILVSIVTIYNLFGESRTRIVPNNAFKVGEKLTFSMGWGPIKAGVSTMEVKEIVEVNGRKAYHIVSEMRTNKFFDRIYKIRDINETFIDVEGIYPLKYKKDIHEGKYEKKRETIFLQDKNIAIYKKKEIPVAPYVQDVLSAYYYVRTKDLMIGYSLILDVNNNGKNYKLKVKILKKERISTPAGKFDTILIEPILIEGKSLKEEERLLMWLTDDENKVPVKIKSRIAVGSLLAKLKKMEGVE